MFADSNQLGEDDDTLILVLAKGLGIGLCVALLGCRCYLSDVDMKSVNVTFDDMARSGDIGIVSHGNYFVTGLEVATGTVVSMRFSLVNNSGQDLIIAHPDSIAEVRTATEVPPSCRENENVRDVNEIPLVWRSKDGRVAAYQDPLGGWSYSTMETSSICKGIPLTLLGGSKRRGRPGANYDFSVDVWIPITKAPALDLQVWFTIGVLLDGKIRYQVFHKLVRAYVVQVT